MHQPINFNNTHFSNASHRQLQWLQALAPFGRTRQQFHCSILCEISKCVVAVIIVAIACTHVSKRLTLLIYFNIFFTILCYVKSKEKKTEMNKKI